MAIANGFGEAHQVYQAVDAYGQGKKIFKHGIRFFKNTFYGSWLK